MPVEVFEYVGLAVDRLGEEGLDFVVFRKGDRVEIVRMGYLSRPQRDGVPALMAEAGDSQDAKPPNLMLQRMAQRTPQRTPRI